MSIKAKRVERKQHTVQPSDYVQPHDHQYTLDGSREDTKEELAGVILFPGGEVEVGESGGLGRDRPPGATEVEGVAC